jgi:hypothetical protein
LPFGGFLYKDEMKLFKDKLLTTFSYQSAGIDFKISTGSAKSYGSISSSTGA